LNNTKQCAKCKGFFPSSVNHFNLNKKTKDGFQSYCKTCMKLCVMESKRRNKDKIRESQKEYRKNNKEKIADLSRKYYENNKEKISKNKSKSPEMRKIYRERSKDKIKEYNKMYRKEKKELRTSQTQRRRAKKNGTFVNFTHDQWVGVKRVFDNKCAYCGNDSKLSQEHFVPLSKGGDYSISNIIPACTNCNSSKGNKNFFEWYPLQEFYNKNREGKILTHLKYNNNKQQMALF
jgi:5-methylcytosine-specific restriction endonuclease McrA